ncbi:MAG: hypothetical protein HYV28_02185 [Ignavibacteriales bacterium]|nr:hypothetical protein [Ignavibacteriales bacterium]
MMDKILERINASTPEPRKFIGKYRVNFSYINKEVPVFISVKYLKINGVSYTANSNLEEYLEELLK